MLNKKLISEDSFINSFSYSKLSTFKHCPQKYKLIYVDGIRKENESIEAFMGKIVHEVLEWLYCSENLMIPYITFDKICQVYDEKWIKRWHENIFIADKYNSTDYYYSVGKRCLSNYYSLYGPTFNQKVEATELKLIFMIDKYEFRGIIDRVDQVEPGKWIVHDYKTGKHPKTHKQAINDIQLALYQIAMEQNFSKVNDILLKFHFLRMVNEVTIHHEREQLEKIKRKVVKIIEKIVVALIDKNNFIPKETLLCNWCYYWEECEAKLYSNPVKRAE